MGMKIIRTDTVGPGEPAPLLKTRFVAEIHSTAYGRADFLYEGGGFVSVTLPKEQWEDMGTPGTVTITVEPGNVLEAEAEAGDGIEDDPIIGLPDTAKTLFDGMVDYYQVLKETRPQDAEDFIRGFIWWPLAKFLADHE